MCVPIAAAVLHLGLFGLAHNWKADNFLGKYSANMKVKHRPVDIAAHAMFSASLKNVPPEQR